jgi:hypothetical protein
MGRWFASWSTLRARRAGGIDSSEADRVACGPGTDPQSPGLSFLLAAARAPAWAEELAGEDEAVTRLVEARRVAMSDSPGRKRDAKTRYASRSAAVRLAAAAASLLIVGGIVGAETGSLPDPVQRRAHDLLSLFGVPAPDDRGRGPAVGPSQTVSTVSQAPQPTPVNSGALDPSGPQAQALCRAWNAAGRDPNGASMDSQSWRALVTIAGGRARVAAMCSAFLDATSAAGTGASSAPASHPGAGPANPSRSAGGKKNSGS